MTTGQQNDEKPSLAAATEGMPVAHEQDAKLPPVPPDKSWQQGKNEKPTVGRVHWTDAWEEDAIASKLWLNAWEQDAIASRRHSGASRVTENNMTGDTRACRSTRSHRPGMQEEDDCLSPSSLVQTETGDESIGVREKSMNGGDTASPTAGSPHDESLPVPGAVAVAGPGFHHTGATYNDQVDDVELGDATRGLGPATVVAHTVPEDTWAPENNSQLFAEFQQTMLRERPIVEAEPMTATPRQSFGDCCRCKSPFWSRRRILVAAIILLILLVLVGATAGTLPRNKPLPQESENPIPFQRIKGLEAGDRFGDSVAFSEDGTTLAVGAEVGAGRKGYVRVYRRSGSQFSQIGQTLEGDATGDQFGRIVALNGDGSVLAVGAWNNDDAGQDAGHAKVFQYTSDSWIQVGQTLKADKAGDSFGWYVALSDDGTTVAVSARLGDPSDDKVDAGYARVFTYNGSMGQSTGGKWAQLGNDLGGDEPYSEFGKTLSLDAAGRRLALGAPHVADGRGRVRVFDYSSNATWDPVGQSLEGQRINDYHSEVSLSSDGSTLAVGMSGYDLLRGLARVYKLDGAVWTQHGQDILGEAGNNLFGGIHITLSGDGNCLAVGAVGNDNARGKGYLFRWSGSRWNEILSVTGDRVQGSHLGYDQALSYDCSWVAFGASELDVSDSVPLVPGYVLVYRVV